MTSIMPTSLYTTSRTRPSMAGCVNGLETSNGLAFRKVAGSATGSPSHRPQLSASSSKPRARRASELVSSKPSITSDSQTASSSSNRKKRQKPTLPKQKDVKKRDVPGSKKQKANKTKKTKRKPKVKTVKRAANHQKIIDAMESLEKWEKDLEIALEFDEDKLFDAYDLLAKWDRKPTFPTDQALQTRLVRPGWELKRVLDRSIKKYPAESAEVVSLLITLVD
jgi:hypothetical protein